MFESITKHNSVQEMVAEAMKHGMPAGSHKGYVTEFKETVEWLSVQLSKRDWAQYDWRFLNGRAFGTYTFHDDGTLYGCYHFI